MSIPTLAFIEPSFTQLLVVGMVALLLFGKRLPEVGKNLGKTIVEFKKGLNAGIGEKEASDAPAEELPPAPATPVKTLQSGTRVTASTPSRKSLPQTEEV